MSHCVTLYLTNASPNVTLCHSMSHCVTLMTHYVTLCHTMSHSVTLCHTVSHCISLMSHCTPLSAQAGGGTPRGAACAASTRRTSWARVWGRAQVVPGPGLVQTQRTPWPLYIAILYCMSTYPPLESAVGDDDIRHSTSANNSCFLYSAYICYVM